MFIKLWIVPSPNCLNLDDIFYFTDSSEQRRNTINTLSSTVGNSNSTSKNKKERQFY